MGEYAQTPYLFASISQAEGGKEFEKTLEEYRGDAATEYERALAAVNLIQQRLDDASFVVLTEDRLTDFNAVVSAIEADTALPPLSTTEATRLAELIDKEYRKYEELDDAEKAELQELKLRQLYGQYGELILARAESIKHTERMIRIHKASEILSAEIMRRRLVAEEKQKQFEQILSQKFGAASNEAVTDARNAVYLRMAGLVEGGGSFFNEFRGWYFGQNQWASDAYSQYHSSITGVSAGMGQAMVLKFWPTQIIETAVGMAMTNSIPLLDQQAIGLWMAAGNTVAEYANFKGVYFQALTLLGVMDQKKLKVDITYSAYGGPAAQNCGSGFFVNPFCLVAKAFARKKIAQAEMEYRMATLSALLTYSNARDTASGASAQAVMGPQREAEDAWAALYYFTRIKDQQTLKERLIEYGRQRQDDDSTEALYQLSEEDLVYLFEMVGGQLESLRADGSNNNPDAAVRSEALDITGIKEKVEYKDAFDRHYDPESLIDSPPGPLAGGAYLAGDGSQYTRIKFFRNNGTTYYRYARLIPKATTPADQYAYDMSKVLDAAVAHGQAIRDQRLAAYMQAGNLVAQAAGDTKLILEDRDQTFEDLFNKAAGHREGGREFTGYRMTYQDYLNNSGQVVMGELEQRISIQKKDWELKEQELLDKIQSWEARTNTILERGRKNWAGAEDRFLAEWRKWRKDFAEKEEEARDAWDVKIADHFKAREAWETGIRQNASEETIERVLSEAVLSLNDQMRAFGQQHGIKLPAIDLVSTLNKAVESMQRDMPAASERLATVNKDIANFQTHFELSEMVGADLLSGALSASNAFHAEMNEHAKRMKVLANVQAYEEYRKMQVEFVKAITVQNESVEQSTASSAMAAGYMRQGSRFVKQAHGTASFGAVDQYTYFDAEGNLDAELAKSGFADKSGEDLVRFLEHESDVAVESWLYTQKLALQSAFESILGRGGEKGLFAHWVGEHPDGQAAQVVTAAARNSFSSNMFERGLAIDMVSGGSGELGSQGARPGGAPAGFYVQLKWMDSWVSQEQNRHIADRQAGMNVPVLDTITGLLDPLIGMGYYQQMAKLEHGTKGGLVAEASLSNLVSNIFKTVGGVVVGAGVGIMAATGVSGVGFGVGAAIAAIGAGVVLLGNSMHANMMTGEKGVKLTDKAAIDSAITIGLSALGGAAAGSLSGSAGSIAAAQAGGEITFSAMANATSTYLAAQGMQGVATSSFTQNLGIGALGTVASAGMQYNASGMSQGFDFSGKKADAALANFGLSTILGGIAGGVAGQGATSQFLAGKVASDLAAYGTQQIYGANFSHYSQLGMTGDWGGAVGLMGAWAQEANRNNQQQRVRDVMNGMGYAQSQPRGPNNGIPPQQSAQPKTLWQNIAGGIDSFGSALTGIGQSISQGVSWLGGQIAGIAGNAYDTAKGWFGGGGGDYLYAHDFGGGGGGGRSEPDLYDWLPPGTEKPGAIVSFFQKIKNWLFNDTFQDDATLQAIALRAAGVEKGNELRDMFVLTTRTKANAELDSLGLDPESTLYKYLKSQLDDEIAKWEGRSEAANKVYKATKLAEAKANPDRYDFLWTERSISGVNYIDPRVKNPFGNPDSIEMQIGSPFGVRRDGFHTGVDGGSGGFFLPIDAEVVSRTYGEQRLIGNMRGIWQSGSDIINFIPDDYPNTESYQGTDRQALLQNGSGLSGMGNSVTLQTNIKGADYHMIFMHMNEPPNQYSTGQKVLAGTQLGTIGSTGRSTGAHGHFEVYAMNEPTHLPNTVYRFSSTRGAYTIDPVYFLNRVAAGR